MAARAGGRRKEVEDPNNTWNMQLMAAVLRGETAEAATLLAKGANPNHLVPEPSMKNCGVTPFMAVALRTVAANPVGMEGNPNTAPSGVAPFAEVVTTLTWLCQNGADPNTQMDGCKGTIFHHCVRHDLADLMDKLLLNRVVISKEPPPPPEAPQDEKGAKGKAARGKAAAAKTAEVVKLADDAPAADDGDALPALADGGADASATTGAAAQSVVADRDLFDLGVRDDEGLTASQLAVALGKVELGRVLLRHGVPNDLHVTDGVMTQAKRACLTGNAAGLETLLNLGDDPLQQDEEGQTLLHLSVHQPACLDVLLDRGVALSTPNAAGQTALSWLVLTQPDAAEAIDALLQRGADPNVGDALLGTTPLMHAVSGYAADAVRRLITDGKADVNARDRFGCTALHFAAVARGRGILEQLLTVEGVEVNAADSIGHTPLHRACFVLGKEEFVACLVAKDAVEVNAADAKGDTALHVAVRRCNGAAVKALLPRVDATTISGPLPAGVPAAAVAPVATGKEGGKKPAAKKGAPVVPDVVVSKLAVNVENKKGLTALQIASAADSADLVGLLVSIAADPRRASAHGNLVHEAVMKRRPALVRLLASEKNAGIDDRNAADKTPIQLAVETGVADVVAACLDSGANPNDQDTHHLATPLHAAVGQRLHAVRDLLLGAGALATSVDAHGRTPLHVACVVDDPDSLVRLLEHGAVATARDADGATPLHSACANDASECIVDLLRAGADFWARDDRRRTPLHVAVACGSEGCTKTLCDFIVGYASEGESALPKPATFLRDGLPNLAASGALGTPAGVVAPDAAQGSAEAAAGRESPAPPRPDSRQSNNSRCASRNSQRRAPSASSLNPMPTIEHDGVTVAVDGAAARANHLRRKASEASRQDWQDALRLQDADGAYPLALAAASGSPDVARYLIRTNAALTARSRGGDGAGGLPPRPPSVSTRASDL